MRVLVFLLSVINVGCAIVSDKQFGEELSGQWVGKSISEATILEGRPPSRVINLPDGVIYYVWSQDTSYTTNVSCQQNTQGQTNCSGGNYVTGFCDVTAQTNSSGIVMAVLTSGCGHFKTGDFRYR
ncbi:MAG: hypothetical protein LZF85_08510 [Nitrosomonas sp.]|uniref:hypothetical protein n=1 Tax=Nitrosomonas sp. TaxID=42353 RepID=UPI0025EA3152|nr:hypothetical protein [Nitrosomonas sp.]UJP01832.1 MAG: hypothetical protein LZF85_08510 [Nitrosomonas sp.]